MQFLLEIVLNLLSHNLMEIKKEMYRICHKVIVTHVGPETHIDSSGSHILFLLSPEILINVAVFGMTSADLDVSYRVSKNIFFYKYIYFFCFR